MQPLLLDPALKVDDFLYSFIDIQSNHFQSNDLFLSSQRLLLKEYSVCVILTFTQFISATRELERHCQMKTSPIRTLMICLGEPNKAENSGVHWTKYYNL